MSVESEIRKLAASIPEKRPYIRGEESTKDALIRPMIRALGYDTWNPAEVSSEFTADFGTKQHEKVDFAIMAAGRPIILIECKTISSRLGNNEIAQLFRYFSVTEARFAILTNGVEYRFYTDLRKRNVMDNSPFLVVNMLALEERQVAEICRFAKPEFDAQAIWDLVHTREVEQKELQTITDNITREFATPSRDLVKILTKGVPGTNKRSRVERERVTQLTRQALDLHMGKNVPSPPVLDPLPPIPNGEPDYSKYEYWRQTVANPELHRLFMALCDYALSLGDDVMVNPTAKYISIRRKRTVAYIKSQTGKIRIIVYVYADLKSASLLEGFTRKLPESFRNPPCNLEITIRNQADLERAKPLIKSSYDEAG